MSKVHPSEQTEKKSKNEGKEHTATSTRYIAATVVILVAIFQLCFFYLAINSIYWPTVERSRAIRLQASWNPSSHGDDIVFSELRPSKDGWKEQISHPDPLIVYSVKYKHNQNNSEDIEYASFAVTETFLVMYLNHWPLRVLSFNTIRVLDQTIEVYLDSELSSQLEHSYNASYNELVLAGFTRLMFDQAGYTRALIGDSDGLSSNAAIRSHLYKFSCHESNGAVNNLECVKSLYDEYSLFQVIFVIWIFMVAVSTLWSIYSMHSVWEFWKDKPNESFLRDGKDIESPVVTVIHHLTSSDSMKSVKDTLVQCIILSSPVLLIATDMLLLACRKNSKSCFRKQIQYIIFGFIAFYISISYCYTAVRCILPGHSSLDIHLDKLMIVYTGVSVGLFVSHLMWILMTCVVEPVATVATLFTFISVYLYIKLTWARLKSLQKKLKSLIGKEELILKQLGLTNQQISLSIIIGCGMNMLLLLWIVLGAIIFYSNRPGTSQSYSAVVSAIVVPVFSGIQHIRAVMSGSQSVDKVATEIANLADGNVTKNIETK